MLFGVDGRFVDEHDGNVVSNRVHSTTFYALERVIFLRQRCFADRTNQYFEKRFIDHFGNSTPMRKRPRDEVGCVLREENLG